MNRRSTASPVTIQVPSGPRVIEKSRAAAGRKTANSATSSSPAPSGAGVGDRHALEQLAAQLGQARRPSRWR